MEEPYKNDIEEKSAYCTITENFKKKLMLEHEVIASEDSGRSEHELGL